MPQDLDFSQGVEQHCSHLFACYTLKCHSQKSSALLLIVLYAGIKGVSERSELIPCVYIYIYIYIYYNIYVP